MKKYLSILMLAGLTLFAACSDDDNDKTVYTVTFETDGGTPVPSAQKVEEGSTITAPATTPAKAGYVFVYWYLSGATTAYNFQTPVNRDITLHAKWQEEATAEYWQVTWNLNGGAWASGDNHATQVLKGGTLAEPNAPVKSGSTFEGWYRESALTNKVTFPYDVTSVIANFTLYAKWGTENQSGDISLNKTSLTLCTTDRERLTVTSTSGDKPTITWSTSNKEVALVSNDGIVKATGKGTTVITASVGDKSAMCNVSVESTVFAVGQTRLWKNGKEWIPNESVSLDFTSVGSMFIHEGDVYIAGTSDSYSFNDKGNRAILVKLTYPIPGEQPHPDDEEIHVMNTTGKQSFGHDMFIENGDIYVCGEEQFLMENTTNVYYYRPTVWKNGVKQHLTNNISGERYAANAIFVSGNDVYVAGQADEKAALWKNGIYQELVCEGTVKVSFYSQSNATSLFVSGNNVYVGGEGRFPPSGTLNIPDLRPILWRNGLSEVWYDNYGSLKSIYISGNDLYAISTSENGQIWKNGILHQVIDGDPILESLFVDGEDVYVAGRATNKTALWKNGIPQELEGFSFNPLYSVTVK